MSTRDVILVTGGTGQIGYELVRELAPLGPVVAPSRSELDLARPESVRETVRRLRPRVIVNAGAYTAVDRAESEPELCTAINAEAPHLLAQEARSGGAVLVHYSTDYVFDGAKGAPYVETDPPAPLNVYGVTKLEGERAIAATAGVYLILRTSWVYGIRGTNFLRTMLRLARQQPEIRVVNDQTGAPTWSRAVAAGTALVLCALLSRTGDADRSAALSGIYHLSAAGGATWYDFARALLESDPGREEQVCSRVVPIRTSEFPTPACRPRYSVLDNSKVAERFGVRLPEWSAQLRLALSDLAQSMS